MCCTYTFLYMLLYVHVERQMVYWTNGSLERAEDFVCDLTVSISK